MLDPAREKRTNVTDGASQTIGTKTLTSLLALTAGPDGSPCQFMIGGLATSAADLEAAAQMIADDAMRLRCGDSPALDRWRRSRDGGPEHSEHERKSIEVFVEPVFNLPGQRANDDHIQGHIAELVWGRLIGERTVCEDGRRLVHTEDIKADPTAPGADGLVVYEISDHTLVFRLWEVKKHDSSAHISTTIGRACSQLSLHGAEYLALLTGPGTKHPGALGKLYADLVDLWLTDHARAGVGISVATSVSHAPKRGGAFGNVATAFPQFGGAGQREGLIVAVADFPAFARRVREIIWTGL